MTRASLPRAYLLILLYLLIQWVVDAFVAPSSRFWRQGTVTVATPDLAAKTRQPSGWGRKALGRHTFTSTLNENKLSEERHPIPIEDPNADPNQESLSGVRYASVLDGLNKLFPPEDLEKRNAASRTDGYWPYVNSGRDPPKHFTYGEFDLYFFATLLDRAVEHYNSFGDVTEKILNWNKDKVFCDIGSGTGRLVLAASALHQWKLVRGVEVLPSIHDLAVEIRDKCVRRHDETQPASSEECGDHTSQAEESDDVDTIWRPFGAASVRDHDWVDELRGDFGGESVKSSDPNECAGCDAPDEDGVEEQSVEDSIALSDEEAVMDDEEANVGYVLPRTDGMNEELRLAPVEFTCGSFEDPYTYYGDADLVFVFSSCMSSDMMAAISKSIGWQCKPGTIVITTEFPLPLEGEIEALEDDPDMPFGSYRLEQLESVDGWCWLVGGRSTAYIHRVVESLWKEDVGAREKPEIPLNVQAWRLVELLESDELTDSKKFLRDVYNNMAFHGMPAEWRPELDADESDE